MRHDLRTGAQDGQAAITLVGSVIAVFFAALLFAQFGGVFVAKGRDQRSADLAAAAAGEQMAHDYWRTFAPPMLPTGLPNPAHMSAAEYRSRARAAAMRSVRANGAKQSVKRLSFDNRANSTNVTVALVREHEVSIPAAYSDQSKQLSRSVRIRSEATAELRFSFADLPNPRPINASGGGYGGPLAYRQGKPMRPDVAIAYDLMAAEARGDGHSLTVTSGFRSDAEQSRLFAQNPDPRMVAPAGTSLHRYGTELDLGPPSAYGWLGANARRFGFIKRYVWEPWHYGFGTNPRDVPAQYEKGSHEPKNGSFVGPGGLPNWVPERFRPMVADSAQRHNVQPLLIAAQLKAESDFNPNAVSSAGAQGIAQFMPATAQALGLRNPFDPRQSIDAQGKLMSSLIRQFRSIPKALAAYNAGPGAVIKYGGIPPYGETQAYVAKILALMKGGGVELDDPAFAGVDVRARVVLVR